MGTTAQIANNRLNARFSTGPRTPQGKAASSRNAVRHNLSGRTFVLLPGEDLDAFKALAAGYRAEFNPATPHETFLVTEMIQARWRLDRIARMEAEAFDELLNVPAADGRTDEGAIVRLYPIRGEILDKLQRYAREAERSYYRAKRELDAARTQRDETKPIAGAAAVQAVAQNEPKPAASALSQESSGFCLASSGFPAPATPDTRSRYRSSDSRSPLHAS